MAQMVRVRVHKTTARRTRVRKSSGGSSGYRTCNMCHGTGKIRVKS